MFVVRPVKKDDLDQVYELSSLVTIGMTTLPNDRKVLERRIKLSVRSFESKPDKPGGEIFFFVIEDIDKKKIVGTCAVFSKVGGFQPFYTYKIETMSTASKLLGVGKEIKYLQLMMDHDGPSEIATLFLSPQHQKSGLGRLLSLSRFLFIAQYPECFEPVVISEMRGVIDKDGGTPFWEAVGKHFFEMDFKKADLMVMHDKSFIADLMPKFPIYVPLLPKEAQEVIGKTHEETHPALHVLEQEGFVFKNEIDIFEAGPVMSAVIENIRTVRESKTATVKEIVSQPIPPEIYMIANVNDFEAFRVTQGGLLINSEESVNLTEEVAKVIRVKKNDTIRFALLKPRKNL